MNAASTTALPSTRGGDRSRLVAVLRGEHAGLLAILVVVAAYFAITSEYFLSSRNVTNLISSMAVLAILATGQLFVIVTGGIDISIAAQIGVLSIVAVDLSQSIAYPLALLLVVLLGAAIGLVNGLMIVLLKISPIITTVAMLQALSGLSLLLTGGQPRRNFSNLYTMLGTDSLLGVPLIGLLAFAVLLVGALLLNRTPLGRYSLAIGSNSEAAYLSGIRVRTITASTYVLNSVFAALAAIALSSRTGSGLPDLGAGIEITTIAAVFIGGVAWGGGRGSVVGALLGVLLIGVIGDGLDLKGVNSHVQVIITGVLMAVAVALTAMRRGATR
jgi:ribose/xylose/arabinose/galactoside ABC-type transport system permease subunit